MIQFLGTDALSASQHNRLLAQLQRIIPKIKILQAKYIYFVNSPAKLSASLIKQLEHLLQAQLQTEQVSAFFADGAFTVIPRLGTISPWSSKALDILHHCGLQTITGVERGRIFLFEGIEFEQLPVNQRQQLESLCHDRMTETVIDDCTKAQALFAHVKPTPLRSIDMLAEGKTSLQRFNQETGLGLSEAEIDYLFENYQSLQRNPTDVELMMFAQINSEHCRHKIFNGDWLIDGKPQAQSLFKMIKNTYAQSPEQVLSAYKDNAAVIEGFSSDRFFVDPQSKLYQYSKTASHIVIKVETHNHPTAISPFAGAATGVGGEIRDEAACGRGAKTKAGLAGFNVSNLRIPEFSQPWEGHMDRPDHIASPLEIMIDGPIGAAAFNNEFGRPNLCGYFRTFEYKDRASMQSYGYHKPIMIAGGVGSIQAHNVVKKAIPEHALIIVLGGPAMLIGLGGGAASSVAAGQSDLQLDFASVQRSNPEMQRRSQQVIDQCTNLGEENPILWIHDVGAGGLSNAIPELVNDCNKGAEIKLRDIPTSEPGLSPLQLWCNEAQERYVIGINPTQIATLQAIAKRERCPLAVVGTATREQQLKVFDDSFNTNAIDVPMSLLFDKLPPMQRVVHRNKRQTVALDTSGIDLADAINRILNLPTVASKQFLITIGDRSVGGLSARDQMVGPWQVPVADVAVTAQSFTSYQGEAMAMGERAPVAIIDPAASARMAVAEALTNILAADIESISKIKMSANWMAAAGQNNEDIALYDAVKAVGMELCPTLDIAIPVGKDSLSMQTRWHDKGNKNVISPLSLIISAVAPVNDIRTTLTPELHCGDQESILIFIDLACGKQRLGGSAFAQVFQQIGDEAVDFNHPELFSKFFAALQKLRRSNLIMAYHDRSDGGLFTSLAEMAFAGHVGIDVELSSLGDDIFKILFNEELGMIIEVRKSNEQRIVDTFKEYDLDQHIYCIGAVNNSDQIIFRMGQNIIFAKARVQLQRLWSQTSYRLQALRDNPECAQQEFAVLLDTNDPGLRAELTFKIPEKLPIIKTARPKVAILREQGVNGHIEMAAAFDRAGFLAIDVHMNDIINGETSLKDFAGLAACGGFSYGDVLGAGRGWANTIRYHPRAKDEFHKFFQRSSTFTLGVCNGCQMLSHLADIIPGADNWPHFIANKSGQYEARLLMVEIKDSPSIFFNGMSGSKIPIVIGHGEGQANWEDDNLRARAITKQQVVMQYIDQKGLPAEQYPANPNGSPAGITGLTSLDGRATIMMPHPERIFRTVQCSWHPDHWGENSPWIQLFVNAHRWVS